MQKQLIAIFILLNIAFSNAVFLKKPTKATFGVFNQLKEIEDSEFGKKIIDTIALQMKTNAPLQEIAKLLAEIRQGLVTQQAEADQLHNQQEQECADTIAQLDQCISSNTKSKNEADQEIQILTQEIGKLQSEIRIKTTQLEILNRRDIELDEQRTKDAESFTKRQQQSVEVVAALELIIEKLGTIPANNNDAKLVLSELSKIGNSNPILALVQVGSLFSEEALKNVINKMDELRTSLEASIEEDKKEEQAAISEYGKLKTEIATTRTNIANALGDLKTQLTQNENALTLQKRIFQEALDNIKRCSDERAAKVKQCEEWRTKWAKDKESRTAEIGVVKQVESIIATKLETMSDYLKERVDVSA